MATIRPQHERILGTLSVFHEEGDSYIVVEYSPEGLLEERARQRDPLPVHEAIALAADTCEKPS